MRGRIRTLSPSPAPMTSLLPWDLRFETGLEAVDRDHRGLLDRLNGLQALRERGEEGSPGSLEQACGALLAEAARHFAAEEALMRAHQVDPRHREPHEAQHRRLLADLEILARPVAGPGPEGDQALGRLLGHWLLAHVLGTDHPMARQIRAIQAGQPPAAAFEAEAGPAPGPEGVLLDSFQDLSGALSQRILQLTELRRGLETEVAARTRDLSQAQTTLRGSEAEWGAARQALELEAARYQAAVNASLDGFWIVDATGRILEANAAYATLSGYSREELLQRTIPDLEAAEDPRETAEHIARVLATGSDLFETTHRRKSGELWPVEVLVTTVPTDPGHLYVFLRDITRRKQAEEALGASEQRYRHLFFDAPVAHALNRFSDGAFLAVNEAFARLTGYTLEELNRLSYWDLTPRRYEAEEAQQLEALRTRGHFGPYEKAYLRKDGSAVPVQLNGTLIHDPDGTPLILSVVSDLSESVRTRRIKDDFISLVSHELRTPLTSIRGGVGLALSGGLGALPPKVEEVLRIAQGNCERLTRIINDLLDVQRMEQGLLDLVLSTVDLGPLLEQAVGEHRPFADLHRVRLVYLNEAGPGRIHTDPGRVLQVAGNLISNAVKFSPEGGQVDIQLRPSGQGLELAVRDHGPGIPEAFRPRVFEKFAQASAPNIRSQGGSGLGLSIVKALTERLGGRVWFDSEPGAGTTFQVWVPALPTLGEAPGSS